MVGTYQGRTFQPLEAWRDPWTPPPRFARLWDYTQAAVVTIYTPDPSSLRSSGNYPRPGVVGDVHRSTPCSVGKHHAVTAFRSRCLLRRARRFATCPVNQRSPHPRGYAARPKRYPAATALCMLPAEKPGSTPSDLIGDVKRPQ